MQKELDEKGGMGRMKPIGKFFRDKRKNRKSRIMTNSKAESHR